MAAVLRIDSPQNNLETYYAKKTSSLQIIYEKCRIIWSYFLLSTKFTRACVKIFANFTHKFTEECKGLDKKISQLFYYLKFASFLKIPFSFISLQKAAQKVFDNIGLGCGEGIALSSLSLAVITSSLVLALGSLTNAILVLFSQTSLEFISAIGTPLSYGLVGLGTISNVIQIVKTSSLSRTIQTEILTKTDKEQINALKSLIYKKLGRGIESEILNSAEIESLINLKKSTLQRAAPSEVVKEFEAIFKLFDTNQNKSKEQIIEIFRRFDKIIFLLDKKIKVDLGNLMSKILTLIGLTLSLILLPSALPFIFFAMSILLTIICKIYSDLSIYNLNSSDFLYFSNFPESI